MNHTSQFILLNNIGIDASLPSRQTRLTWEQTFDNNFIKPMIKVM